MNQIGKMEEWKNGSFSITSSSTIVWIEGLEAEQLVSACSSQLHVLWPWFFVGTPSHWELIARTSLSGLATRTLSRYLIRRLIAPYEWTPQAGSLCIDVLPCNMILKLHLRESKRTEKAVLVLVNSVNALRKCLDGKKWGLYNIHCPNASKDIDALTT